MLKKALSWLMVCGVAVSLVACNTMEGVGKDLKKGGEKIEKAATKS